MSDELKTIEGLYGPYAGKRLTVSPADAEQAIADRWAKDPFAPVEEPKEGEELKLLTDEERQEILDKAEKAAKKLRGEEEEGEDKPAAEKKAMAAEESQGYQTRDARSQPAQPTKKR